MPIDTSDVRSNADIQILHAAELLSKSEDRQKVFREIYGGGSKGKTAEEIAFKIPLIILEFYKRHLYSIRQK